jgi:hypothetical protein
MAEEQQLEEQQENKGAEVAEQFAAADAGADPNAGAAPEPPSIEEIASRMGWVPKEKFRGDESDWKPADKFILDGNDIKSAQGRELKEMRRTLDNISKTSGAILAERLQAQREELAQRYEKAVEKGDPDEAFKLSREIISLGTPQPESRPMPDESTVQWVERNPWMKAGTRDYDPVAASRAVAICDQYARADPNMPPAEQIRKTEAILRTEFPHLFQGQVNGKAPPGVNEPSSRVATQPKRGKTSADLPKAARDIAQDMVDRGLIKDVDAYARNYFAQEERMQ